MIMISYDIIYHKGFMKSWSYFIRQELRHRDPILSDRSYDIIYDIMVLIYRMRVTMTYGSQDIMDLLWDGS